jgi:predicted Zn finger-like uncharacterized protein
MICSCPKCGAHNEVDPLQISSEGSRAKCSGCKTTFLVNRETIASRASRKAGEINCSQCGKALGTALVCLSCGQMYPDYFVAETQDAVRKRQRKLFLDKLSRIRDFEVGAGRTTPGVDYGTERRGAYQSVSSELKPGRLVALLVTLAVVVVIAGGGVFYYKQFKAKQLFAEEYIKALYGVKSGADFSLAVCARMSEDLKNQRPVAKSPDGEAKLIRIKAETDKIILKLASPPNKFIPARERLLNLHRSYMKLNDLALSVPADLATFADATSKAEGEFRKGSQDLKAGLTPELGEKLKEGALKYKGLRDF